MTIGERIKQARLAAGLTQKELAKLCGLESCSVSQYEQGIRQPKLRSIAQLAQHLHIPAMELLQLRDGKHRR